MSTRRENENTHGETKERKKGTHIHRKEYNKKYVQGIHLFIYIYIYIETYSYLGTTTVRMDEVCISRRQTIHTTTKKKKIQRRKMNIFI